ncbi:ABC transporter substrate-binding protein [Cohnella nanjingensis]|uniref:Sugar ABC transporter substrate-binding protein n=1 Tax=Cohnella nanjingensis TaxID=1387779 RepID=A0A7X0RTK9_9BACL|nr:sugar ABC transporter substrate-binding protein [Cohnella nanjingensis]MBB6673303.1 sugar ABC transporter substrate-binding protein [Cohnella nanjingensis]
MTSKFRYTALTVICTLMVSVFAACGSGNKEESSGSPSASASSSPEASASPSASPEETPKKDITLQFWTISLSPNFDDYINGRIKKFQDENPGITVKWTDLPYDAMENKLLTSIAGGKAPDVVNLNTGMTMTLAGKNALVDLNAEATEDQRSIYFENLYNSAKLGDSVYAFPWYYGLNAFMYNKELYEKAGLDPAKPPTTWDELKEQAVTIKQKTGKYGFVPTYNPPADLYFSGVPVISDDKKKMIINTPEALEWVKWNKALYDEGVVPKESLTADANYATDKYQSGQIATLTTGAAFLSRVKTNAKKVYDNTLVAPMPALKTGKYHAGLMNLVVPEKSKNHKEAIALANFMTNDESQLEFCKIVNILPSTKKAAADPFFTEAGDDPESKAKIITAQEAAQAQDFTLGVKDEGKILESLWKNWQKMLLGKMTPEEYLSQSEAAAQKVLDEVNKANG